MKKVFSLLLVVFLALTLVACSKSDDNSEPTDSKTEEYQVAVVTDVGQLNDGGFNQGTYEGAVEFAKANGMTYKYYQPANGGDATDDDRIAAMRQAIENGAEVIVTPGFLQAAALETVTEEAPDVKFVFVDGWNFGKANLTAICYQEEQSGFFAGYAAVKDGYTKLGGTFGGGGTNAACNRFAYGYVQGIEAAAAELGVNVEVVVSFLYGGSFSSSPELQTQISGWYNNGTEVVFSCGGSMLQSVKAAANETANGKIIGVDVDQHAESDRVLTSAVKGLTPSVIKVLNEWKNGEWDAKLSDKTSNLGATDDATGLPTSADAWRFEKFTVEEYEALFAKVASGELPVKNDVSDNMGTTAAWANLAAECAHVTLTVEE